MQFSEFTGEIQHRLELGTQGEAVRASRIVLTTLGERLQPGEASDLAAPLPREIGHYIREADSGQRFDYNEFVERVAERADIDQSDAAFWGQTVMTVVAECVPAGELGEIRDGLPADYADLFDLVEADATPWA